MKHENVHYFQISPIFIDMGHSNAILCDAGIAVPVPNPKDLIFGSRLIHD